MNSSPKVQITISPILEDPFWNERILIVSPANLAFQWQRKLKEKFDEKFTVMKGAYLPEQFGVNQLLERNQIITSLVLAKRTEILPSLKQMYEAAAKRREQESKQLFKEMGLKR